LYIHLNMKRTQQLLTILFITAYFIFTGCHSTSDRHITPAPNTPRTESQKPEQALVSNPTYKELTEKIIDSIPDDKLEEAIMENIWSKMNNEMSDEYDVVKKQSKARQAIYIAWQVDAEVNNGGFNQFYVNSSRLFANDMEDAYKAFGAYKYANLVHHANKIYQKEKKKITQDQDGSADGFSKSYDNNPLNELDDAFYALEKQENINGLKIAFIRKNKADFIDRRK
jgi:hypothetical protein